MFCTQCGIEVAVDVKFCDRCGNPIRSVDGESGIVPPREPDQPTERTYDGTRGPDSMPPRLTEQHAPNRWRLAALTLLVIVLFTFIDMASRLAKTWLANSRERTNRRRE